MENENTKTWTAEMWEESLPIYETILKQPFIKELADGSLSQERFSRYIAQDEIYLGNYGKQMEAFAELLDKALQEVNSDYEAKRHKDITLQRLELLPARKGLFDDWLKSRGKLGGQHKVPRLCNDRTVIEQVLAMM